MYETLISSSPAPHVEILIINRPEVRNAINTTLAKELTHYFKNFTYNRSPDPRVLILTGHGPKAFSAGADLKERNGMSDDDWRQQHLFIEGLGVALEHFPLPLIAAVNGVALGGGCELALACDFIIASEEASFGQPEVKLGIIPGLGGTQRLPRAVPVGFAKELLFTGRRISAKEALAWGLVNHVVPAAKLLEETLNLAKEIAASGPLAVREVKKAVKEGLQLPIKEAMKVELRGYQATVPTKDRREGIAAFNEKRLPKFTNQ